MPDGDTKGLEGESAYAQPMSSSEWRSGNRALDVMEGTAYSAMHDLDGMLLRARIITDTLHTNTKKQLPTLSDVISNMPLYAQQYTEARVTPTHLDRQAAEALEIEAPDWSNSAFGNTVGASATDLTLGGIQIDSLDPLALLSFGSPLHTAIVRLSHTLKYTAQTKVTGQAVKEGRIHYPVGAIQWLNDVRSESDLPTGMDSISAQEPYTRNNVYHLVLAADYEDMGAWKVLESILDTYKGCRIGIVTLSSGPLNTVLQRMPKDIPRERVDQIVKTVAASNRSTLLATQDHLSSFLPDTDEEPFSGSPLTITLNGEVIHSLSSIPGRVSRLAHQISVNKRIANRILSANREDESGFAAYQAMTGADPSLGLTSALAYADSPVPRALSQKGVDGPITSVLKGPAQAVFVGDLTDKDTINSLIVTQTMCTSLGYTLSVMREGGTGLDPVAAVAVLGDSLGHIGSTSRALFVSNNSSPRLVPHHTEMGGDTSDLMGVSILGGPLLVPEVYMGDGVHTPHTHCKGWLYVPGRGKLCLGKGTADDMHTLLRRALRNPQTPHASELTLLHSSRHRDRDGQGVIGAETGIHWGEPVPLSQDPKGEGSAIHIAHKTSTRILLSGTLDPFSECAPRDMQGIMLLQTLGMSFDVSIVSAYLKEPLPIPYLYRSVPLSSPTFNPRGMLEVPAVAIRDMPLRTWFRVTPDAPQGALMVRELGSTVHNGMVARQYGIDDVLPGSAPAIVFKASLVLEGALTGTHSTTVSVNTHTMPSRPLESVGPLSSTEPSPVIHASPLLSHQSDTFYAQHILPSPCLYTVSVGDVSDVSDVSDTPNAALYSVSLSPSDRVAIATHSLVSPYRVRRGVLTSGSDVPDVSDVSDVPDATEESDSDDTIHLFMCVAGSPYETLSISSLVSLRDYRHPGVPQGL
ncbi:hypothetical protein KIPB_000645 [Kipferlia bialata]|uniref:Uncharacterized protein n=1 Tax=Kipferlia bialata TaxID=797122 RepID=A0A9K3GDL5_9EUKA|nr:hypothetical protein KIPB_000645 [Kipferlia bialata]|eukprot:g645.t1